MPPPNHYLQQSFLLLAVFLISFNSCKKEEIDSPAPPVTHERGDISKTVSLGTYSTADIQQIYNAANVQIPFNLEYDVKILSVNYYTVDGNGNQIIASGAFFIPQGTDNLALLSFQHGTETKRDRVASVSPTNSTEGIIALMTASMGYVTVVADYPGFGVSNVMHPYFHAESLTPCVIDFMRACKSYSSENHITLDGRVFLSGYSEGGYLTLLTQKEIEEKHANEFSLTAVAPMAGLYDLKGTVDTIITSADYLITAYVAYFLTAYNEIYGWNRLDDFFKAPYAAKMPALFDGSKTWGEIINQLPATFSEMINTGFVSDYNNGNEPELVAALQENTFLDWTPQTPIHFFHGDADVTAPYQNVLTAIETFTANGATDIQLTTIPGGTHETAGPAASMGAIQWFEGS